MQRMDGRVTVHLYVGLLEKNMAIKGTDLAYKSFSDVPWYRRSACNTIFVILSVFGIPLVLITVLALLTGDIYYKKPDDADSLRTWSKANRGVAIFILIWIAFLIWAYFFAPSIFRVIMAL